MDLDLPPLLQQGLIAQVEHHATISSTNDRARALAAGEGNCRPKLPLLVVADRQTAGRGRGANRWWTGEGSLALSLLLDPVAMAIQRQHCGLMSLAAALAIVETVSPRLPEQEVGLHWPNDVFAAGRKLAGVLVEALPDGRHIVGIGLNVNNTLSEAPEEVRQVATTMRDLTGRQHPRSEVLGSLLSGLQRALQELATDPEALGSRFDSLCLQHGQSLTLEAGQQTIDGICRGVASDGALLLLTPSGLQRFYAGVLRRPTSKSRPHGRPAESSEP